MFPKPIIKIGVFTVLKLLIGFLLAKWVVLSLGAFGFSIYSTYQGLLVFLLQFFGLGAGQGIIKLAVEYKGKHNSEEYNLDGALVVLSAFLAIAFLIILLFFKKLIIVDLLESSISSYQFWLGGGVLTFAMFGSPWNFVRVGFGEGDKLVRNGFYFLALSALLLYVLKPTIFGFLLVLVSYYVGQFIVSFCFDKRFWTSISKAIEVKVVDIRKTIQSIAPFMIMALFMALGQPFIQVILRDDVASAFGNDLMGKWQGVLRISDSLSQITSVVLTYFLLPKIVAESEDKLKRKHVKDFIIKVIPIVFLVSLTFWWFSDFILRLLYDDSFTEVSSLVAYQAAGDVFRFCNYAIVQLVIAKANWRLAVFLDLLIAALLYLSYMWLKDSFGLESLAIGYFISHSAYFLVLLFSVLLRATER